VVAQNLHICNTGLLGHLPGALHLFFCQMHLGRFKHDYLPFAIKLPQKPLGIDEPTQIGWYPFGYESPGRVGDERCLQMSSPLSLEVEYTVSQAGATSSEIKSPM
jgi:hypothetical protein